jgi:hypothetical protein
MKQVIRISLLMLGLVGAYASAAVPQVPAPDGMPILTKPPADGMPILTKPPAATIK